MQFTALYTPKLLAMKLTAILLLGACLTTSARTASQTITLKASRQPLEKVLQDITRQTGYEFLYHPGDVKQASPVTIEVSNLQLTQALDLIFRDQPLRYEISNRTIVVSPKVPVNQPLVTTGADLAPLVNIDVTITVLNTDGQPLEGATIINKQTSKAIGITGLQGRTVLKAIDPNVILEVSFTGYMSQEIKINNRGSLIVRLTVSTSELDEVQIGAYSKITKRFQTGNVTTVKGEDIAKQPVGNPLLALEGQVAGLFVTQNTGVAGGGVTVRIEGQNSIRNGNDPLYVIDGVPYSSQLVSTGMGGGILGNSGAANNGQTSGGVGSPLSYINPSDIDRIEVLKDADATAIYGSLAANGAILITTKRGKSGLTKIDINVQQGWEQVAHKLDMMNTQQYLSMRREAFRNDNLAIPSIVTTPTSTDYDINGLWDSTRNTDWQKVLIGNTGQYSNVNLGISGGNSLVQFNIGGTYHKENSVFPSDFSDQKLGAHFSVNSQSANKKFNMQLTGNYLADNNQLPTTDLTNVAIFTPPDAPPLYNTDGTVNWAPRPSGNASFSNPVALYLQTYQSKTNNLLCNSILSYHLLPELEVRSSFGYTHMQTNIIQELPFNSQRPENQASVGSIGQYAYNTAETWIIEPQISYKKNIKLGRLDVLIGATINQQGYNGQQFTGQGYVSNLVLGDINSAATVTKAGAYYYLYKYNAAFGRINFIRSDKYVFDFTLRQDVSSRFGPSAQKHNFGSGAIGWIFSQEKFVKNSKFLSFGKIRISYGTTGSDQVGDYSFLNLYAAPNGIGVPYQGAGGLAPRGLSNPYIAWEENKKLSTGLNLGFLKDRILLDINYSINSCSNQLLPLMLPAITGFGSINENFPATVQNTSLEFVLNTSNIKGKSFDWSTNVNLTMPRNKLVSFPNLSLASAAYSSTLVIGQPVSIIKAIHFLGVNPATGLYMAADIHGNPTFTPNGVTDKTVLINTLPTFYGGFGNKFTYKGFQLDLFFQFVKQIGYFNLFAPNSYYAGQFSSVASNQMTGVANSHWQKPGDIASFERYTTSFSIPPAFPPGDAGYADASYIRLKNLSFSYTLPAKWISGLHMENFRVYIQAQNLFTITKYKGLDPENQGVNSLPPLRVVTLGLQIGL